MTASDPVLIAADHAGIDLKAALVKELRSAGITVEDLGPATPDSVDYPDYAEKVASLISSGQKKRGILICGSGIGMSIAANKFPGVRAALAHNTETARLSRLHNDANILCLGARFLSVPDALEMARVWLSTAFSNEPRHEGRVGKIKQLEAKHCS